MSKGGTQTSTSTQAIDPRVWAQVDKNVNRATGIADQGFQAYTGNPYQGAGQPSIPATQGSYSEPPLVGYDETGNPQYGDPTYTPGTPAVPGTDPQFNPNSFVAPLTANQNTAIAGAPGLLSAGQGAVGAGVNGAAGLLNYRPQNIMPVTANTNTAQSAGYNPALLNSAPQAGVANVNRSNVRDLSGGTGADGMSAYQNPYQQQVIDASLGDIERQRQLAIGGNQDAAVAARAFGGSRQGVADSLTNEAYGRQAANTAAQLRSQGFDTAAGLAQQDASRGLQAQGQNQSADLNVAGQNAGAANTMGQFNTGLLSQFGLSNQGAANQAGQFNSGNQQAANLYNAGALNQGGQFNAGAINSAQGQNQQAGLSGAGINAGAAGLLGQLGGQQQSMYGTGLSGLLDTGSIQQQNQQGGLDAAYQEFLRRLNQPMVGQSLINQSLGLLPQGGTTTQTGPKPDGTAGMLGGVGGLLSGIGALAAL